MRDRSVISIGLLIIWKFEQIVHIGIKRDSVHSMTKLKSPDDAFPNQNQGPNSKTFSLQNEKRPAEYMYVEFLRAAN